MSTKTKELEAPKGIFFFKTINKCPYSLIIEPVDTIVNEDDVQEDIACVKSSRRVKGDDGKIQVQDKMMDIEFLRSNGGVITIKPGDKRGLILYRFLKRCNANADNPHRMQSVTPRFFEWDPKAEQKAKFDKRKLVHEATSMVFSASNKELREMAKGMKDIDENQDFEFLQEMMAERAEKNPSVFINNSTDSGMNTIKEQVGDGVDQGIIDFDSASNEWKWLKPEGLNKKDSKITAVPVDQISDPKGFLVDYFATGAGNKKLGTLIDLLEADEED